MMGKRPSTPATQAAVNAYPFWSPRFWHGMRLGDWLRLCARHGFRIHPLRWPMALIITLIAPFNTVMAALQRLIYGGRIEATPIAQPPLFIIGHWRSGTTHLHELLVHDDRFAFPTTYECFAPTHFLLTGAIIPRLLWFLLPRKRPMDNMAVGFDRPQEDELAICVMGSPSPMLHAAFPNDPPPLETLNMDRVDDATRTLWSRHLQEFIRTLTFKKRKRLVLKSPPHTGRIRLLSELFPGALFVHITRDPESIFPSTQRLWRSLDQAQGLQIPRHRELDEFVFSAFERMYEGFENQRDAIDPARLIELRYEDLVRDPLAQIRNIYETFELGNFDQVRPRIDQYVRTQKDYRPNRHELEPKLRNEIRRRWAGYIERYGYGARETARSSNA